MKILYKYKYIYEKTVRGIEMNINTLTFVNISNTVSSRSKSTALPVILDDSRQLHREYCLFS